MLIRWCLAWAWDAHARGAHVEDYEIKLRSSCRSTRSWWVPHLYLVDSRLVFATRWLLSILFQFITQPNPVRQWATDAGVVESSATLSDRAAMYTWNCWIQWPWRCGKATRLSLVGAKSATFSVYLRTAETAGVGRCGDDELVGRCTTHSAADDWRGRDACER